MYVQIYDMLYVRKIAGFLAVPFVWPKLLSKMIIPFDSRNELVCQCDVSLKKCNKKGNWVQKLNFFYSFHANQLVLMDTTLTLMVDDQKAQNRVSFF